jgi:hypothetical protein
MAHKQDYIPTRDADFDGWFENLTSYVTARTTAGEWPHIPAAKVTGLSAHDNAWHTAYEKTLGPHTPVDTEAKNDERKSATAFIRPFVAQYLMFDPVTNEDRTAMRLHNRDAIHTPIGKPATRAVITDLKPLGGFRVEIRYRDETTPESRAIPYGCNGCLLNYVWAQEKTADYAALTQTRLMTRSPWTLELPPEAEGKFLSCAARWQNETGVLGTWGDIQHVVIA